VILWKLEHFKIKEDSFGFKAKDKHVEGVDADSRIRHDHLLLLFNQSHITIPNLQIILNSHVIIAILFRVLFIHRKQIHPKLPFPIIAQNVKAAFATYYILNTCHIIPCRKLNFNASDQIYKQKCVFSANDDFILIWCKISQLWRSFKLTLNFIKHISHRFLFVHIVNFKNVSSAKKQELLVSMLIEDKSWARVMILEFTVSLKFKKPRPTPPINNNIRNIILILYNLVPNSKTEFLAVFTWSAIQNLRRRLFIINSKFLQLIHCSLIKNANFH